MLESLYLQLGKHDELSNDERTLLAEAISLGKDFEKGQDLVSIGSRPVYSTMLLDGLAARYKVLENGGRQFTSLQVPGASSTSTLSCSRQWIMASLRSRLAVSCSRTTAN